MKELTLAINIDSLRHDYVTKKDMPFLYRLREKGIKARLIPSFGFEPDGAYLTGTHPETYEGGMHFIYNEEKFNIPLSKYMPKAFDILNTYMQHPIRIFLQWFISKNGRTERIRKNPFIGQIPFSLLKYFDFCEKSFPYEAGFGNRALTIFDYLRREKRGFFYHGAPEFDCSPRAVRKRVLTQLKEPVPFIFLFISGLDDTGHNYGPDSKKRCEVSSFIDSILHDIYAYLSGLYDKIDFIIFGDHGMVNVKRYLDFRPILKGLPLKLEKDYIYFLDSTFARFWSFNDRPKEIITDALGRVGGGSVITEEDKNTYHIHYKKRIFGDIIFWADKGVMIFPNFWHVRHKKRGMHGYRREVQDNHAAFIFNSSLQKIGTELQSIEMVDVFQTIMYSLFGKAYRAENIQGNPIQNNIK